MWTVTWWRVRMVVWFSQSSVTWDAVLLWNGPGSRHADGDKASGAGRSVPWQKAKHLFVKMRRAAVSCNLEGEQCRETCCSLTWMQSPLRAASWVMSVGVCVMVDENAPRLALRCHPLPQYLLHLCLCVQSESFYLAVAFVGEETATTGMWAHRAALIRWGLMPCATTAYVRRSVLQLCLAFEDGKMDFCAFTSICASFGHI